MTIQYLDATWGNIGRGRSPLSFPPSSLFSLFTLHSKSCIIRAETTIYAFNRTVQSKLPSVKSIWHVLSNKCSLARLHCVSFFYYFISPFTILSLLSYFLSLSVKPPTPPPQSHWLILSFSCDLITSPNHPSPLLLPPLLILLFVSPF